MPSHADSAERAPVRHLEPLSAHTTLRIGGPAEHFYEPQRPEDLASVLTRLAADGVPIRLLGGGANTLAPDGGVRGAVVHTGMLRRVFREGDDGLRAWAGVTLPQLVRTACDARLSGLEPLIGVPGQFGGALAMNAGSASWGIWDAVDEITLWDPSGGGVGSGAAAFLKVLRREDCQPVYRDGRLGACVVLEARLRLRPADPATIRAEQEQLLRRKNASQPVTLASAGCAFKNPPGDSAGRLVDAAGLKGARIGGAEISSRHANFIVNCGGARAAEVRALVERAEQAVQERFGVRLERELVIWPEPDAPLSL